MKILEELSTAGLKARAVPAAHLTELRSEYENLLANGSIAQGIRPYLEGFRWDLPSDMGTILSVAMPSPIGQAVFTHTGKRQTVQIPPTYLDYGAAPAAIAKKLNGILAKYGYRATQAKSIPEKLLAVRSGLGEYGRNNICYVEGLGSFAFLSAWFTDMPCDEDGWRETQRMKLCDKCTRCLDSCPTGAIVPDRNVIDGGRCLTAHNEAGSGVPFPQWINHAAHNSLVGCMLCQSVCPKDREYLSMVCEPVEFDEHETMLLLAGTPPEDLPETMSNRMQRLNLLGYYDVLKRNLSVLLDR